MNKGGRALKLLVFVILLVIIFCFGLFGWGRRRPLPPRRPLFWFFRPVPPRRHMHGFFRPMPGPRPPHGPGHRRGPGPGPRHHGPRPF